MTTIKLGSRGSDVAELQRRLGLNADGIFGPVTLKAVKKFQSEHGLEPDGVVGPLTWRMIEGGNTTSLKKSKRHINEIIVHCSATVEGKNYTVEQIRQWHLQRGFNDIGYHYVIYLDGTLHDGRDVDKTGAHCTGHNAHSIGICYIGGLDSNQNPKDTRTVEQKRTMIKLIRDLKTMYPKAVVHGHRDFATKACPCFDAYKEYYRI